MSVVQKKDCEQAIVLVVDDESQVRRMLSCWVERTGYGCRTASNAVTALEIVSVEKIDVIITDINMPGMDGIALMQEAKRLMDVAVIVMTGQGQAHTYEDIIGAGASDFIEKPIGAKKMILRLKRVVSERNLKNQQCQAIRNA